MKLIILLIGVVLFFVGITYILHKVFKKHPDLKYIPTLVAAFFTASNVYYMSQNENFLDFGSNVKLMWVLIIFVGFLVGIISAFCLDLKQRH